MGELIGKTLTAVNDLQWTDCGGQTVGDIRAMRLFVGLDIGTSGARVVVVNHCLEVVHEASLEYQTTSPCVGWAEQRPDDVFDACIRLLQGIASLFSKDEIFVVFSSVMHSIVAVDADGTPRTQLITWADSRAHEKCTQLRERYGSRAYYDRTGCALHSCYWPARILWFRDFLKETDGLRFVSIKEYIVYRLTGRWLADESLVSTSGLMNLGDRDYDPFVLDSIGVSRGNLSEIVPAGEAFSFTVDGKSMTGLAGSTDGPLANLGVGAVAAQDMVLTAGTSSAVRFVTNRPVRDPEGRVWCYVLDRDYYVAGLATNGAGTVLKWLSLLLGYETEADMIAANIPRIPYEGNDIISMPTLMGERGPNYNEQLRGLLYGLSLNHSRSDIVIAFYEGVAMFLRMIYEEVTRVAGTTPATLLMTGQLGITQLFSRLCSYLIGETSCVPQHSQSTAIGAAMLGIREIEGTDYCDLVAHLPKPVPNRVEREPCFERYLSDKYNCFIRTYELLAHSVKHRTVSLVGR